MQPIIFGQYMVIEKDDAFQGARLRKGMGKKGGGESRKMKNSKGEKTKQIQKKGDELKKKQKKGEYIFFQQYHVYFIIGLIVPCFLFHIISLIKIY